MKVKACIREGTDITERMEIEQAHKVGKAIVVKFLSYNPKILVLTNARKLKTSDGYNKTYVREDFSETVQKKRQQLMTLQRELRPKGHSAKLPFDKLISEVSMCTHDLFNDRVTRHNRRHRQSVTITDPPRQDDIIIISIIICP